MDFWDLSDGESKITLVKAKKVPVMQMFEWLGARVQCTDSSLMELEEKEGGEGRGRKRLPLYHVITFSDLIDLWVIKIKSPWSFVHAVHWVQVNRARNTDHVAKTCERFINMMGDTFFRNSYTKVCELLDWAFRVLICWAGKLWSHDN